MYQFIAQIYDFLKQIINNFVQTLINNGAVQLIFTTNTAARESFVSFMSKDVFKDASLIGFNITWQELFLFFGTLFLVVFFIVLFVKLIFKLLGLFRLD